MRYLLNDQMPEIFTQVQKASFSDKQAKEIPSSRMESQGIINKWTSSECQKFNFLNWKLISI